jgi:hypothetical protein
MGESLGIVVPAEGEKVKSFASKPAPKGRWGVRHFLADEKKGLAKQDLS